LEKGSSGASCHGIGDEGIPFREIAGVIGRSLNLPVVSKSAEGAGGHFGFLGQFVAIDCPASSALTQNQLGWRPTQPGLLSDLDRPSCFSTVS
jgi:hypothetical protein